MLGIRTQETRVRTLLEPTNAPAAPKLGTDATLLSKWRPARAIDHQSQIAPVPALVVSPQPTTSSARTTPASTTPAKTTPRATPPASDAPATAPQAKA